MAGTLTARSETKNISGARIAICSPAFQKLAQHILKTKEWRVRGMILSLWLRRIGR